ncbi:MAG: MFS transporter [Anaerolineales bacterium]|nr:MFS transporter [Anaerolineales bacterium]
MWNIKEPFDRALVRQARAPLTGEQVHSLRYFWYDGIFAAISEAFYLAYIPLFALAYGATNQQVGWITAVGNLAGALALFPGARMLEKTGKPKSLVVWTGGGIARVSLLLLAVIPIFGLPAEIAIAAITLLNGLRAFMANFCNPAWTSLVAEIVPDFMRGRYFSERNMTMGIATLLVSAVAGWLVYTGNTATSDDMLGFQIVFALSFATGMVSTFAFSRIIEPQARTLKVGEDEEPGGKFAAILRSPGFVGFVASAFVWNLALQIAAPFFNVYLVTHLGADTTMVGIATAASSLTGLLGLLIFGRLMDRKGAVWLVIVTGFPIVVLPVLWAFYTDPYQVVINNLFGGFLWAGYNLANFNLLLQLTPHRQRAHAVALYQTAVFSSAVIGPLIGGYIADNVIFQAVFVLSGLGRLIAMFIFVGMTALPLRRLQRQAVAPIGG